jgi:hypothetical protein
MYSFGKKEQKQNYVVNVLTGDSYAKENERQV